MSLIYIIEYLFSPSGSGSQPRRGPDSSRAEQPDGQDTEPRGPGTRSWNLHPHRCLRSGCGICLEMNRFQHSYISSPHTHSTSGDQTTPGT